MSWINSSKEEQRLQLVQEVTKKRRCVTEVAGELGISRQTAHLWLKRYGQEGLQGLKDRSRRPQRQNKEMANATKEKLLLLRQKHPTWGPKKLLTRMVDENGKANCCEKTLGRWLRRWKLVKTPRRRLYHLVKVEGNKLTEPSGPNTVWTVDFKGWFKTLDGARAEPLTVRDLFSRFCLAIQIVEALSDQAVRRAFVKIFKEFGLPEIIRVDNGTPLGGSGPYGLSSLSLWWIRLGIKVEFIRPARPCENGAHEQFHRVYKQETLQPPAATIILQQRRSNRWRLHYNVQRPHEAMKQRAPAQFYQPSPRKYWKLSDSIVYPPSHQTFRASKSGCIYWHKRQRLISRIVANLDLGLLVISSDLAHVYLGKLLIGSLYTNDPKGMRGAKKELNLKPVPVVPVVPVQKV